MSNKIMPRLVKASSLSASYNAGVFCTATDAEAIEQAREAYRTSSLGRMLNDVGAFRFYIAKGFDLGDFDV